MTIRQQFLQLIYPLFKRITKLLGKGPAIIENRENILPAVSFYSLSFISNAGEKISMNQYAGKKILIVNTASDCGYTAQYAELQQLQDAHAEMLAVIGFPANDFKQQERRDDDEIAAFCKKNYGISFPLAKKSSVIKGGKQNEIFQWLSDADKNGWCSRAPVWNFCKYLIDEKGMLIQFIAPYINPVDIRI